MLEAAGVAVLMQGGPAFTHVPEVLAALEHLQDKARDLKGRPIGRCRRTVEPTKMLMTSDR